MAKTILQPLIYLAISAVTFIVCYFLAIVVSVGTIESEGLSLIMMAMYISFAIHWILFIPSYIFQTEKFYDLTGSLTYITVLSFVVFIKQTAVHEILDLRSLLLYFCIMIWTVRLGSFLFWRVLKDGHDKRFKSILPSFSQLFMTWTLSAAWVFIQALSALVALSALSQVEIGNVGWIGLGLWIFGFGFQVLADYQKTKFKSNPSNEGKFITGGLWDLSRHPNYFGEVTLWIGISVMAVPVMSGLQYVSLISPLFGFLLIYFVSGVRMLEHRSDKKWGEKPEYQEYKRNTPVFFPKLF
jgi:steroid 5-alpha reductase family enzyme